MQVDFTIQKGYTGREVNAIILHAHSVGLRYTIAAEPMPGTVPVGSVEFCEPVFPEHTIEFYPVWMADSVSRGGYFYWVSTPGSFILPRSMFVKDASRWKNPNWSKVFPKGTEIPEGGWYISDPVNFVNEWRYYICQGAIMTAEWYNGRDEDKFAPKFPVEIPKNFSGVVDLGELDNGNIELVESHAPFACGWYGERHQDYVLWQYLSWKNLEYWEKS